MHKHEQYSDAEIISKILSGEMALYEILIRRYNPFLYKVGRSYNFGHDDTQDLMQDTFINAYVNLPKFQNRSSFKTWLIKIMLNNCYRKKQKHSFKNEISNTDSINENSKPMYDSARQETGNMVLNHELSHIIESSLMQLPEDYRMVFSLREMNGLSTADTAEVLNISEANVKVRLNRAKAMLRSEIEKVYTAEDIFEFNLVHCGAMVDSVMKRIKEMTQPLRQALN
jgi:RNA polymerase sigma factor (sigma-70 family)